MGNYADLLKAQTQQQPLPPARQKPHQAGRSARPVPASQQHAGQRPIKRSPERTIDRTHAAPNARTPVRRSVKRYSFELYDDQIERVKRLALEDQLRGGTLNMSVIVRQAIDRYLVELEPRGD